MSTLNKYTFCFLLSSVLLSTQSIHQKMIQEEKNYPPALLQAAYHLYGITVCCLPNSCVALWHISIYARHKIAAADLFVNCCWNFKIDWGKPDMEMREPVRQTFFQPEAWYWIKSLKRFGYARQLYCIYWLVLTQFIFFYTYPVSYKQEIFYSISWILTRAFTLWSRPKPTG